MTRTSSEPRPEYQPVDSDHPFRSCLDRPYLQQEIRWAREHKRKIIIVFEKENHRPGFFDYGQAFDKYKGTEWEFILGIDAVAYQREQFIADAMMANILAKATTADVAAAENPINRPGLWEFYMSHHQARGGDQMKVLSMMFVLKQKTVWLDQDMMDRSERAMEEGVKHSKNFVLLLTADETVAAAPTRKESPAAADRSEAAVFAELERNPAPFEEWHAAFLDAEAKVANGWSENNRHLAQQSAGTVSSQETKLASGVENSKLYGTKTFCSSHETFHSERVSWACPDCGCGDYHGTNTTGFAGPGGHDASWDVGSVSLACGRRGRLEQPEHQAGDTAPSFDQESTCAFAGRGLRVGGVVLTWLKQRSGPEPEPEPEPEPPNQPEPDAPPEAESEPEPELTEAELEATRTHIAENILTLQCPRCQQAFMDWQGSFALTCSRAGCGCGFCAFCLADCGGDAHEHLLQCALNPNKVYSGSDVQFQQILLARREREVRECLMTMDEERRKRVAQHCCQDFEDMGMAQILQEFAGDRLMPVIAEPEPQPEPQPAPEPEPEQLTEAEARDAISAAEAALWVAIKAPNATADAAEVERCLRNGADPKANWGLQRTALYFAAWQNQLDCLGVLERYGADINKADHTGVTPLMKAASAGHADVVQWLLTHDADWQATDNTGKTAMHIAKEADQADVVGILTKWMTFKLLDAVKAGDAATTHELIVGGADPNSSDDVRSPRMSALGWASALGHEDVVRVLLESADIDRANGDGWTPLMEAAAQSGRTHQSIQGRGEVVRLLLQAGASVTARATAMDFVGKTALDVAKHFGDTECIAQLESVRADISISESGLLGATRKLNTSKLIVTGDGRVGKTSLLKCLRGETFNPAEVSTVGVVACTVDVREEAWGESAGGDGRYETMLAAEHLQQEQQAKRQTEEQARQREMVLAQQREMEPEPEPEPEPVMLEPAQPAPVPVKQPLRINGGSERTVQTGHGMSIALSVKSYRSRTAQWLKDGEAIVDSDVIRGTTTTTLVFDSVHASNAGVYCCRVSDGDEVVTSAGQTLELVPSEPITLAEISPAQTWVNAGGKMDFGVKVSAGGFPDEAIVLDWYHSGKLLDIHHAQVSRNYFIVINDAGTPDAGEYYVDVQYKSQQDAGAEPVRSKTTTVHVTGSDIQAEVARIIREKGEAALTDDTPTKVVHDFAGQRMYYILHAILLTRSLTRYVVAVSLEHDLTDPLEDPEDQVFGMTHGENLDFWLNSIHSGAPEAPILLICTKTDLVPDGDPERGIAPISEAQRDARVAAVRESLKGKPYYDQIHPEVMCVSSKTGDGVKEVRKVLDDMTAVADYGDAVPLKWFKWHKIAKEMAEMDADSGGRRRISYEEAVHMATVCDIDGVVDTDGKSADVDQMLQRFHDVGFIMWHNHPGTCDLVVLDVQWMLDQMTALLCHRSLKAKAGESKTMRATLWDNLRESGRLHSELIPELWPELQPWERQSVLKYMISFGHCCELYDASVSDIDRVDQSVLIVPTLLPQLTANIALVWPPNEGADRHLRVCFVTVHGHGDDQRFLPDTLFFRLISSLLQDVKRVSDAFKHMYNDTIVVRTPQHRYMLRHIRKEHQLELTVYGGAGCEGAPAKVLTTLTACLDSLQKSFGVQSRYQVECMSMGETDWHALDDPSIDDRVREIWVQAPGGDALPASPAAEQRRFPHSYTSELHQAIDTGDVDAVQKADAVVFASPLCPNHKITALHRAVRTANVELVRVALGKLGSLPAEQLKAALDATTGHFNRTCFMLACESGASEIAGLLVQAGVDTTAVDNLHRSGLEIAAQSGHGVAIQTHLATLDESPELTRLRSGLDRQLQRPDVSEATTDGFFLYFQQLTVWAIDEFDNWVFLAEGSFGKVFLVTNVYPPIAKKDASGLKTYSKVVVKAAKMDATGELKKETEDLAKLEHPNIVRILGFTDGFAKGSDQRSWMLLLDFCQTDLDKLAGLSTQAASSPEVVVTDKPTLLSLLADTARGLGYIHSMGQLHSDVKPKNILVANIGTSEAPMWQGRVSDFGMDAETDWVGSYMWMAPECTGLNKQKGSHCGEVGYPADVFSFAIMAWMIMNHIERWYDDGSRDLGRVWINTDGSEAREVGKGHEPKNPDGTLAGKWTGDMQQVAKWYYNTIRPEFPDDWHWPNLRVLIEACWAQDQKERPAFQSICRLMAADTMLELAEPEPEPAPQYGEWLSQLGLADKKDALADCGLDDGLELQQLREYGDEELGEDVLDDEDLDLDDDTKAQFRTAVEALRDTAAAAAATSLDQQAASQQSPRVAFDALLDSVGSATSSSDYPDLDPAAERSSSKPQLRFLRDDGTPPPQEDRKYDFFINHCQASGQDQCANLDKLLKARGASVWYDMQAQDLTAQGMEEAASQSRCMIIFLSDDVMGRPFCNAEQRWGEQYDCNLIGVVEKDTRHNPADFAKEKLRAPADLKHLLADVEFIEFRRRDFEANAMVDEILKRGAFVAAAEPEPEPELAVEGVPSMADWGVADVAAWLTEVLKMPSGIAEAVVANDLDGSTVIEMAKDDWKELGATGVQSSKIYAAAKKLT